MILIIALCCFLGLGALQPSCAAPRSNENNIVETKFRQNYSVGGQYSAERYFGMLDICSYTFFNNTLNYIASVTEYNNNVGSWTFGNPLNQNTTLTFDILLEQSVQVSYFVNNVNIYYQDIGYLDKISVTKTTDYNGQYTRANLYKFDFYFNYNNTLSVGFTISIVDPEVQYLHQGFSPSFNFHSPIESWNFSNLRFYEYYNSYTDPNAKHFLSQMIIVEGDLDYMDGYRQGYENGYNEGLLANTNDAYARGVNYGENHPNTTTYNTIFEAGQQAGYSEGLSDGQASSGVAQTIFAGCVEVGLLPVNVFLKMFEYEVFGINIAGFVSALMTIAIVIIIIRMVTGGKNDK